MRGEPAGGGERSLEEVAPGEWLRGADASRRRRSRRRGGRTAPLPHWPSPICLMNSPLSQNRYSSNMMPCLFQWPMVAIGIR
jgi:hypothetical protein